MLGLSGAHRTGKSTLAKEFAAKHNWKFTPTSVSKIFADLGHSPSEKFDFETRLTIQEQVLIRLNRFYSENQGSNVITDRTPIDLMAYTLAEAVGDSVHESLIPRLKRYIEDCYATTNRHFGSIVLVQPGIPLVSEDGKAVANEAYIEHLNTLIIGLCVDGRLKVPHFYIPRNRLDMSERIASLNFAQQRAFDNVVLARNSESCVLH